MNGWTIRQEFLLINILKKVRAMVDYMGNSEPRIQIRKGD